MRWTCVALTARRKILSFNRALVVSCLASGAALTAGQNPPGTAQPPTFRAETVYLEVDARVTDKHHQFVSDLHAADFQLLEDGKPQVIATFSMVDVPHVAWSAIGSAAASGRASSDATTPRLDGRVYVALVDDLHIDSHRAGPTVKVMEQFINEKLAANDAMAVMYASERDDARQMFTNDRNLLRAAVERLSGRGVPSVTVNERGTGSGGSDLDDAERVHLAVRTMTTVQRVASALANVHGRRKSILFFSEGIDYDYTKLRQHPDALEAVEATQEAVAAAIKANVTVYAVDARGAAQLADDSIEIGSLPHSAQGAMGAFTTQRDDLRRAQNNLRAIADQTGGFAIVNRNDFRGPFDQIVDENTSYYLLGYYAQGEHQDGKAHKIEVHVNRRDLDIHARQSYTLPARKP